MSPVSFKGKVVLVTGAGSVIGTEVARHFSKLGAVLVLTDTDKSQLNKVNGDCGSNCLLIAAELTKNEDVLSVFKQTIEKFKRLDVLVNYAGTGENCDHDASSLEHYDTVMNVNVRVVYNVTMQAAPHLVKTKGNVVNVSGLSSGRTLSHVLSKSVSRSALEQLTKCVALQLASEGVRVNAVSPDMVETNSNAGETKTNGNNKKSERTGSPKDVADAVVFLASDCAAFISGANLPVDGGRHLACNGEDINGNQQLKEDTQTKSMVQPLTQNTEVTKHEVHKGEPVHKQDSKGAAHKQNSKGEQTIRDPLKEEPSKPTSRKQGTAGQDKSSSEQDADKNQHAKPGNKHEN